VKKVDIDKLPGYPWAGHREILSKQKKENKIIEAEKALRYFGKRRRKQWQDV